MQPRYNNPSEFEFRIQSIEFLSDMKDKMINSITLKLPIGDLNDRMLKTLHDISTKNKGKSTLAFTFFDPRNNVNIRMHSRTCHVKIDNALISELNGHNIKYEIK